MRRRFFSMILLGLLACIDVTLQAQDPLDLSYSNWTPQQYFNGYAYQIRYKKMNFEDHWSAYQFYNGYDKKMYICWSENTGFYGCDYIQPRSESTFSACTDELKYIKIEKIELLDQESQTSERTSDNSFTNENSPGYSDNEETEISQYDFAGYWTSSSKNRFLIQIGLNVTNLSQGFSFLWTRIGKNLYKAEIYEDSLGQTVTWYYTILGSDLIKAESEEFGTSYWSKE